MNPAETVTPGIDHAHVLLAHGGGGELMQRLLDAHVLPALGMPALERLHDAAIVPVGRLRLALTTDAYVVRPVEFPGGDIGRLALAGTVNDLAMSGARPLAIAVAMVLEEGLPLTTLDRVLASLHATADEAGVEIVTGDTKVIERRTAAAGGDEPAGLMVTTTGLGLIDPTTPQIDARRVEPGDRVLINGPIAAHGLAVLCARGQIELHSPLRSDVAPLWPLVEGLLETGCDVRFLRDPTRGGLATVLVDLVEASGCGVTIEQDAIPIDPAARHAAELLGIDPLEIANEGKCVAVVAAADARRALELWRSHPLGREAAIIGTVTDTQPPLAELRTPVGGRRIIRRPYGEHAPRIC